VQLRAADITTVDGATLIISKLMRMQLACIGKRLMMKLESKTFTVLWSGGKDSTAALLWVLNNVKSNSFKVLYVEIVGNTDQRCNDYVLKTAESLGIEDKLVFHRALYKGLDFFQLIEKWGVPVIHYRWCLTNLKVPAFKFTPSQIVITGIRKSESKLREKYVREVTYIQRARKLCFNPIWDWNKKQVIDYLKDYGVKPNPCYETLGHGGNCCFCPFYSETQIVKTLNDPYWRQKILTVLEKKKENLMKGSLGRQIYCKWMKYAKQRVLMW